MEDLGLKGCVDVSTPGTATEGRTKDDYNDPLDAGDETRYRALVARANYLTPDRADIAFAVKEQAKAMSKPTVGDWERLKRLGRYLKGKPGLQQPCTRRGHGSRLRAIVTAAGAWGCPLDGCSSRTTP